MRAAAYAAGTATEEPHFAVTEPDDEAVDLAQAVEVKKRDNLALGAALVSLGLIGGHELAEVHSAQAESDDLVGELFAASAIRSRLGEMLLKAKRITSSQLEFALELQRLSGRPSRRDPARTRLARSAHAGRRACGTRQWQD